MDEEFEPRIMEFLRSREPETRSVEPRPLGPAYHGYGVVRQPLAYDPTNEAD